MTDWAKKANWLWAVGIFTVVYLAGALWIVGPVRVWTFIKTGELNEIGDFLAGVFSPLAFIWLVAAVLTQRQELDETRDQFGENQKVVDAQMKTISSQNELLALQHRQAERSASQTYRLNLFDRRLAIFESLVKLRDDMSMAGLNWQHASELRKLSYQSAFVFSTTIEQYLADLAHEADLYLTGHSKLMVPDIGGQRRLSSSPDMATAIKALTDKKQLIENALIVEKLMELMWPSMRVSDD